MPKGLDIMLAVGKADKKPMAEEPMVEEMEETPMEEPMEGAAEKQMIMLPKGFRLPEGAKEGEPFTTTIRGVARNGQLEIQALGDMPMHSEGGETPEEEGSETEEEEMMEPTEQPQSDVFKAESDKYKKKKADEMAANKVFRG